MPRHGIAGSWSTSMLFFKWTSMYSPYWMNLCTLQSMVQEGSLVSIPSLAFILFKVIYSFTFGCTESWLLSIGFLYLRQAGATLWFQCAASHCGGFWLQNVGSRAPGFRSCIARAQQLWFQGSRAHAQQFWSMGLVVPHMWNLLRPGIKPVSPAFAGWFLITTPPGKS